MIHWLSKLTSLSFAMLIAVALLCAAGVATIQAQDADKARQQMIFIAAGVAVMAAMAALPYRLLGEKSYLLFALSLLLLAAVLDWRIFSLPAWLVPVINGSRRWIRLGPVNVQASELAKLGFILMLAWYLRYRTNYHSLVGLLWPFMLTLVPVGLVLVEPDLGTALLFLPVLFAMLFVAGARAKHLLIVVLLGLIAVPAFWPMLEYHQKTRVRVWLAQGQSSDPVLHDHGYQLRQAQMALGSGGLVGQGLRQSIFHRHDLLPEDDTDFIFALIGHQWGLLGCAAVLAAYLVIFIFGVEVAASTAEPFARLLAVGVTALMAAQMAINSGMAVGLLPITGMTLPFVSYGGSSLLVNFAALGVLLSIRRRRPILLSRRRFEWDEDTGSLT